MFSRSPTTNFKGITKKIREKKKRDVMLEVCATLFKADLVRDFICKLEVRAHWEWFIDESFNF
jgi:hypothetical protein